MNQESSSSSSISRFRLGIHEAWRGFRDYFGSLVHRRDVRIDDSTSLKQFLDTRASYIAQTSLYGYLRTRAGMLYPQLFDNDEYVQSINAAKWYVWLACLSDLSIYTGGLLVQQSNCPQEEVGKLVDRVVTTILIDTGTPDDAGEDFPAQAERVQHRIKNCDWLKVSDDETPFSESPTTLIRRAPIVENLKELDEEIVRNSVRFRWQEVRRALRSNLDAEAVLQSAR